MSYDSLNNTGSILYELDPGANFRSFPFDSQYLIRASSSNGYTSIGQGGNGIEPEELNAMFNYTLTGIITEGSATMSGSSGWIGSLQTITSDKSYWLITTGSKFPAGASKVSGSITGSMINPQSINSVHGGANALANPYSVKTHLTGALNPNVTGSGGITEIVGQGSAGLLVNNSWVGSLQHLEPGQGYWFVVSGSGEAWDNEDIPIFQSYNNVYPTSSTIDTTEGDSSSYQLKYLTEEAFYECYGTAGSNGEYLFPGYNCDPSWYRPTNSGSTYGSTFGHWQSTEQMFIRFKSEVNGTGSLRDVNGNSIGYPGFSYFGPEAGWFSPKNGTGSLDNAGGRWPDRFFYTGSVIYNHYDSASVCFAAANWTGHPLGANFPQNNGEFNTNYIDMMGHFDPGAGTNPISWPTNALPNTNACGGITLAGSGGKLFTKNAFKIHDPNTHKVVPASLYCESGSGAWGEPHYIFLKYGVSCALEFAMFYNEETGSSGASDTYPFGPNSGSWSVDNDGFTVLSASKVDGAYHFGECYIQAKI